MAATSPSIHPCTRPHLGLSGTSPCQMPKTISAACTTCLSAASLRPQWTIELRRATMIFWTTTALRVDGIRLLTSRRGHRLQARLSRRDMVRMGVGGRTGSEGANLRLERNPLMMRRKSVLCLFCLFVQRVLFASGRMLPPHSLVSYMRGAFCVLYD